MDKTINLRRSSRLHTYESNGRMYLADKLFKAIGRPSGVAEVHSIVTSPTVRPHLQTWYRLCIEGSKRFNKAAEWINSGDNGYFHNATGLEEDLLLLCLSEGRKLTDGSKVDRRSLADNTARSETCTTLEVWAKCAWRITNNIEVFDSVVETHPAAAYAWAIDLLCISFHSIAHRGDASCWKGLILGLTAKEQKAWDKNRTKWLKEFGEIEGQILEEDGEDNVARVDESLAKLVVGPAPAKLMSPSSPQPTSMATEPQVQTARQQFETAISVYFKAPPGQEQQDKPRDTSIAFGTPTKTQNGKQDKASSSSGMVHKKTATRTFAITQAITLKRMHRRLLRRRRG